MKATSFQLVTRNQHQINAVETTIQNIKNHFLLSGLATYNSQVHNNRMGK